MAADDEADAGAACSNGVEGASVLADVLALMQFLFG